MSDDANFNEDASNRTYKAPYTDRQPVPNVHEYAAAQGERQAQAPAAFQPQREGGESKLHALIDTAKIHLHIHTPDKASSQEQLYSGQNRNVRPPTPPDESYQGQEQGDLGVLEPDKHADHNRDKNTTNGPEPTPDELNTPEKRKPRTHIASGSDTREVTDPITHLPVTIHDSTSQELGAIPENESHVDSRLTPKSEEQLGEEAEQSKREHRSLQRLFPPPSLDATRAEIATVYQQAVLFGLGSLFLTLLVLLVGWQLVVFGSTSQRGWDWQTSWSKFLIHTVIFICPGLGIGGGLIWAIRKWLGNRIDDIWEGQVWEAARTQEQDTADCPTPESTQWLNSILASVWSLVNPDLFAGLADTLEDVMQASLPKLVRMVSVEDLGQGSEALRILGIRWLPTGAAAMDVSVDGKIKPNNEGESGRKVPEEGKVDSESVPASKATSDGEINDGDRPSEEKEEDKVAEGMEAEEGDFVNVELAFSYRASSRSKSLKVKSKNAHLYLAFYLPGAIKLRKFSNILILRSTRDRAVSMDVVS